MQLATAHITEVATMNKFQRAGLLARSLKLQRTFLDGARIAIAQGRTGLARTFLEQWEQQRRAYKLALAWQSN